MWIANNGNFTSQFRYVELMRWFPHLNKPVREMKDRKPVMIDVDDLPAWRSEHKDLGLYTSIAQYSEPSIKSSFLANLYFDLDADDPAESFADAIKLIEYLQNYIPEEALRIYYSGAKGVHIEAEAIALGATPRDDLIDVYRRIANTAKTELSLATIDFAVYDNRRMWRLRNSVHQKSWNYKREISLEDIKSGVNHVINLSSQPGPEEIPPQTFNFKANEWYREFTYAQERPQYSSEDILARFEKYGTGISVSDGPVDFDPIRLFEGCPSILRLWRKAEIEHYLTHEERLFLLSILSYNEEALEYLYAILKNCSDYNEEKSRSHIDDWIRRRELEIGGRPYTCAKASAMGVGCGDCNIKAKPKYEKVGNRLIETGELADPSPVRFAYIRRK